MAVKEVLGHNEINDREVMHPDILDSNGGQIKRSSGLPRLTFQHFILNL